MAIVKSFAFLAAFVFPSLPLAVQPRVSFQGKAFDASQRLDFTDSTQEEIKSYYNYDLISGQKGKQRRKSLYDIISKDNTFVSYSSGVTNWYKITDRNWALSQTIDPASYRFSDDDKIVEGKPVFYETRLYFEDNTTEEKQINTNINGFSRNENLTKVDWVKKQCPKPTGEVKNPPQVDKEHVWVKSHGFSPSGDPTKGAGTDLHHLIAADHNTNNRHNDLYYGEVADHQSSDTDIIKCVYADGTTDVSGWIGKTSQGETCFEPTDKWKGDIARALLYRGVRYSNYLATNTESEPYLELTDDITKKDDNDHYHGVFHNLSTFLKWNKSDPVDEYERHRNNLIYKNVQNNRNPFVDFPSWADQVYAPDSPDIPSTDSKTSEKPSAGESTSESEKPSKGSSNDSPQKFFELDKRKMILLIVLAVILFIFVCLILYLLTRKKKQKPRKGNYNKKKKPGNQKKKK